MPSSSSNSDQVSVQISEQQMILYSDRTMYWPEQKMLIVSDLHIGKVMHFRKFGYAVPVESIGQNWERLSIRLLNTDIKTCLFLGDLFHSTENIETDQFWTFLSEFPELDFILVKGNHDVHSDLYFEKKGLSVCDHLDIGPFKFTHEPIENPAVLHNVAGHLHPCVKLRGKGRSYMRLPCFHVGESQTILPSFGVFTGAHPVKTKKGDRIYVIADNSSVLEIERS